MIGRGVYVLDFFRVVLGKLVKFLLFVVEYFFCFFWDRFSFFIGCKFGRFSFESRIGKGVSVFYFTGVDF